MSQLIDCFKTTESLDVNWSLGTDNLMVWIPPLAADKPGKVTTCEAPEAIVAIVWVVVDALAPVISNVTGTEVSVPIELFLIVPTIVWVVS